MGFWFIHSILLPIFYPWRDGGLQMKFYGVSQIVARIASLYEIHLNLKVALLKLATLKPGR